MQNKGDSPSGLSPNCMVITRTDTNIPLNAIINFQRDISQSKADNADRLTPVKEDNAAILYKARCFEK